MTRLGALNFLLQFFFIRLTRVRECTEARPWECSMLPDGSFGMGFRQVRVQRYWAIMYWVVPFTGWWSKFIYVGRCRQLQITSPKDVIH